MIDFLWKLNLKPILGSDRNVEEFECMQGMIEETSFRRLQQLWSPGSTRRRKSDLSDRGSVPIGFISARIRLKRLQSAS